MAVDELLLNRAIELSIQRPVVRIYGWAQPSLSIGRHQRLTAEAAGRCAAQGIDVVRRPTGGTAVLHDGDVTYSVVAPHGARGTMEAYRWVATALIAAFRKIGLQARVGEHTGGLTSPQACFAATVGADLEVDGKKICGSAQVRRRGWFLQHGSIPMKDGWELTCELLDQPDPGACSSLSALVPGIQRAEVEFSLIEGFSALWGEVQTMTSSPEGLATHPFGRDYACSTL